MSETAMEIAKCAISKFQSESRFAHFFSYAEVLAIITFANKDAFEELRTAAARLTAELEKRVEELEAEIKQWLAADQHVAERLEWVIGACEIDRDAKHELESLLLYGHQLSQAKEGQGNK